MNSPLLQKAHQDFINTYAKDWHKGNVGGIVSVGIGIPNGSTPQAAVGLVVYVETSELVYSSRPTSFEGFPVYKKLINEPPVVNMTGSVVHHTPVTHTVNHPVTSTSTVHATPAMHTAPTVAHVVTPATKK